MIRRGGEKSREGEGDPWSGREGRQGVDGK